MFLFIFFCVNIAISQCITSPPDVSGCIELESGEVIGDYEFISGGFLSDWIDDGCIPTSLASQTTPVKLVIYGSLFMDTDYTFASGSKIVMHAIGGAKPSIAVQSGNRLRMVESRIYGCDHMWNWIVVAPNAAFHIINSEIEDGIQAINPFPGSTLIAAGNDFKFCEVGIYATNQGDFTDIIVSNTFDGSGPLLPGHLNSSGNPIRALQLSRNRTTIWNGSIENYDPNPNVNVLQPAVELNRTTFSGKIQFANNSLNVASIVGNLLSLTGNSTGSKQHINARHISTRMKGNISGTTEHAVQCEFSSSLDNFFECRNSDFSDYMKSAINIGGPTMSNIRGVVKGTTFDSDHNNKIENASIIMANLIASDDNPFVIEESSFNNKNGESDFISADNTILSIIRNNSFVHDNGTSPSRDITFLGESHVNMINSNIHDGYNKLGFGFPQFQGIGNIIECNTYENQKVGILNENDHISSQLKQNSFSNGQWDIFLSEIAIIDIQDNHLNRFLDNRTSMDEPEIYCDGCDPTASTFRMEETDEPFWPNPVNVNAIREIGGSQGVFCVEVVQLQEILTLS